MNLKEFKDNLAEELFGPTDENCCVFCKQPFTEKNVHSEAGWKEVKISQLCEDCFDLTFIGGK